MLSEMGISFRQNVKVGKDVKLEELQTGYEAVLLGIGAWKSVKIGCPGEEAKGVYGGIDFLFRAASGRDTGMGKTVAVIGGGNTAMDAARTALRLGANKVYNFYRRTRLEMPADDEEIAEGTQEGIDFRYLCAPVEIMKDSTGRVCRIKLQKMKLGEPDESGRRKPEPIVGQTEIIEVDTVIAAIGQVTDEQGLTANSEKVFIAGDAATGVTLTGLKYPLNEATLTNDYPLGVSNEFTGVPAKIQVRKGTLIIAWTGGLEIVGN